MEGMIECLAQELGADIRSAAAIAKSAHRRIVDPAPYALFPDSRRTVELLSARGWRQTIISNNHPDLEASVEALGLRGAFEEVFTSARLGYEKPRREAYQIVLDSLNASGTTWMIGDNEQADAFGAVECGLRAILVRTRPRSFPLCLPDLARVAEIVDGQDH
jgi:putative hydrolase of the HAD superfamily